MISDLRVVRDRRGVVTKVELDGRDITDRVRALEVLFTPMAPTVVVRMDVVATITVEVGPDVEADA